MNIHSPHTFTITVRANHARGTLTEEEALAAIRSALSSSPMISVISIASTRGVSSTPPVTIATNSHLAEPGDDTVKWG